MSVNKSFPSHLAWHETLELHELVASQAAYLVSFKKKLPSLQDPALRGLYAEAIHCLESNLKDLLKFYPMAPGATRMADQPELLGPESAQLLGFAKTSVRNYAIAITETATPQLRAVFQKHLNAGIELHAKIFTFMYERGLYPAYNLEQLLAADVKNAQDAINLK